MSLDSEACLLLVWAELCLEREPFLPPGAAAGSGMVLGLKKGGTDTAGGADISAGLRNVGVEAEGSPDTGTDSVCSVTGSAS